MKLVLADPKHFKDSITVISELVNEARFKITKEGVDLVAMDPANVAMVTFKLLSSAFTLYELEKDTEICVNLSNLKQVLRRAKANDMLTLELPEEGTLRITLKSNSKRTFNIPLIDLEDREQKVPNLTFPLSISTTSAILNDAIEDASIVAESVSFVSDPEKFTIEGTGDLSKALIEIKADNDQTKIKTDTTANVRSKYSIEYLKKMMNGAKLADTVDVYFSQDYPLKLEYKVIDRLQLSFILAPRVETDRP
ncbi:proliferating cell nuclear antigen (pcna) [Candidatus Woesearchaeota archaeon]|nr:proliferating cell nuclear antigen (pcna) [Candidatus Woesearchaeota archaeon]